MGEKIAFFTGVNLQHIPYLYAIARHYGNDAIWLTDNDLARHVLRYDYKIEAYMRDNLTLFDDVIIGYDIKKVVMADFYFIGGSPEVNKRLKFIQCFHGGISDRWHALTIPVGEYDMLLRSGKRCKDRLDRVGFGNKDIKIVGYPRMDYLYKNEVPTLKLFKNPKRITILFAPTIFQSDKMQSWMNAVLQLHQKGYNVILKTHVGNAHVIDLIKKQMMEMGVSIDSLYITADYDILPYMKASDLMITDNSGCLYEYLHFNKPIIALNYRRLQEKDDIISLTYGWRACHVVDSPQEIEATIRHALKYDTYKKEREELLHYAFKHIDGNCGMRAKEVIDNLRTREQEECDTMQTEK